jgi:thioredoxin reductase
MSRKDLPRLAIIGAGPIGLEAGLQAAALQLPFTVYERGRAGEHLRRWGHVRLFSPFAANSTPLGRARLRADHPQHVLPGDHAILTGREHVAAYLEPLAQLPLLQKQVRTETTVVQIGRRGLLKEEHPGDPRRVQQPFLLLLRNGNRELLEEADVVLDCSGTYGQPRSLGDGGIPAIGETSARQHIAWGLEDVLGERRTVYADKTTLVVGSGYSAATSVCNLAKLAEKHPATWVIWLARGGGTQPIKRFVNDAFKERDQLAVRANQLATRGDGNVEFHAQTIVTTIECAGADKGFKVHGLRAGKAMTWEADRLIANVGFVPDDALARELHHPEANFFTLGVKSYGRDSRFLLRDGFEQVQETFRLFTTNAEMLGRFAGLRQLRKISA